MTVRRKSTVHAMFVWQGFLTQGTALIAWGDADGEKHGGQIGAAILVAEAVELLAQELGVFWESHPKVSFPGVFDYEVSESLGAWLRLRNCDGPSHDCIRRKARALINAFFLHGSSA